VIRGVIRGDSNDSNDSNAFRGREALHVASKFPCNALIACSETW
jgi:hypothetical protein